MYKGKRAKKLPRVHCGKCNQPFRLRGRDPKAEEVRFLFSCAGCGKECDLVIQKGWLEIVEVR